jgi:hypothetical protein
MEERLLAGLQEIVLQEEFIDYVLAGLQEELRERSDAFSTELKAMRDEKHKIEAELNRLVEVIASGSASPAVMAAINQREARIREITNRVIEPGPGSLEERLEELRTFAFPGSPGCGNRWPIRRQFMKPAPFYPSKLVNLSWSAS